jgi:hypothetical protein
MATSTHPIDWNLRFNENMLSGCISDIYDCYTTTDKKLVYVLKILTNRNSKNKINRLTIELQIKLSKLGIMPEIIDQGIRPAEKGDPITFKRRFFVMTKYMIDGIDYLKLLLSKSRDPEITTILIRKYYKSVFDLYRKLASNGVCSFDSKHRNIVLNYDHTTLNITDIRIIDIDYAMSSVCEINLTHLIISQYFVAMVLMLYLNDGFTHNETYPTYDCYKNIIRKIDFDYLSNLRFDLIEDCMEYKTGTYIGLFYCYYGIHYGLYDTDLVEFGQSKNQIELFTPVFEEILKRFPFYSKCR